MKTHFFSGIRPFSALTEACWKERYTSQHLLKNTIAGITVGIIAIPLAMARRVAPQYELYTSAVAGIATALCGGSRFSVSGPTAAFVVILYPVSQQFSLAGLLIATLMSGLLLIIMRLARLGRLFEFIPLPITLGFTSGIAITIGTMQIKDFFGLHTPAPGALSWQDGRPTLHTAHLYLCRYTGEYHHVERTNFTGRGWASACRRICRRC